MTQIDWFNQLKINMMKIRSFGTFNGFLFLIYHGALFILTVTSINSSFKFKDSIFSKMHVLQHFTYTRISNFTQIIFRQRKNYTHSKWCGISVHPIVLNVAENFAYYKSFWMWQNGFTIDTALNIATAQTPRRRSLILFELRLKSLFKRKC